LIQYKFAEYLNLLYIIDVSEDEVKKWMDHDLVILAGSLFSNCQTRMAKVWFKTSIVKKE
jgi:hypothetical protein